VFLFELLDDFFVNGLVFFLIVESVVIFLHQNLILVIFLNYEKVILCVFVIFRVELFKHIFRHALLHIFRGLEFLDFVAKLVLCLILFEGVFP
jgi:hypothetical protein